MSTLSLWTRDPFGSVESRDTFGWPTWPTWSTWPTWAAGSTRSAPGIEPGTERTRGFVPAAEVDRDGDDAVVRLELPGLDVTKDVTVEVAAGRLVVRGERRDERATDSDGYRVREVRYGSFHRSFTLPAHVGADAVSASYDAGILSIRVAGAYAGSGARRIEVTSGSTPTDATGEAGDQPAAAAEEPAALDQAA